MQTQYPNGLTHRSDPHLDMEGVPAMTEDNQWTWPLAGKASKRADRAPLMRNICYSLSAPLGAEDVPDGGATISEREGIALSLNVSSGGMLLMMGTCPTTPQVMRLSVPTPIDGVVTPTLAEVRWCRRLPFPATQDIYFVGVRFLF